MSKKILGLITKKEYTLKVFLEQLCSVFGQALDIESRCLSEDNLSPISANVVLVSGKETLKEGRSKELLPDDSVVILAERTLNINKIDAIKTLLNLPHDTKVLVTNNTYEEAVRCIDMLCKLGIDHLDFMPYYPGQDKPVPKADYAVVFGFLNLAPPDISSVIDLGIRQLDVCTINEIVQALDFKGYLDVGSSDYIRSVVLLCRSLVESASKVTAMNKVLDIVINISHDGILVLDELQRIILCNDTFCQISRNSRGMLLQKNIREMLPQLADILKDETSKDNVHIVEINKKPYMLSIDRYQSNNALLSYILVFRQPGEVQDMEIKIRQHLHRNTKGNKPKYTLNDILTIDPEMIKLKKAVTQVAQTDFSVIIYGESGTGKELFAHAIHNCSNRAEGPFVAVNLASMADNLLESELFGYEQGAFTGARKGGKPGLFELAHKGTIFLDEIGEISLTIQTKLLRVIQEREVMRVGGTGRIPVDVRLVTATNKDLLELVREGSFRRDLYYRINVLPLVIPPLRERPTDIVPLLQHFLSKHDIPEDVLSSRMITLLTDYSWPGNVRELENVSHFIACTYAIEGPDIETIEKKTAQYLRQEYSSDIPFQTNVNDMERIRAQLETHGFLQEFKIILEQLQVAHQEQKRLGRRQIQQAVGTLSVQQVRNRLEILEELGLVVVGKTRQGTWITEKGLAFIKGYNWG